MQDDEYVARANARRRAAVARMDAPLWRARMSAYCGTEAKVLSVVEQMKEHIPDKEATSVEDLRYDEERRSEKAWRPVARARSFDIVDGRPYTQWDILYGVSCDVAASELFPFPVGKPPTPQRAPCDERTPSPPAKEAEAPEEPSADAVTRAARLVGCDDADGLRAMLMSKELTTGRLSLLERAAESNASDVLRMLLVVKIDGRRLQFTPTHKSEALYAAVEGGHAAAAHVLLDAGAGVAWKKNEGLGVAQPRAHDAVRRHCTGARRAVELGADASQFGGRFEKETPLQIAYKKHMHELAHYFVDEHPECVDAYVPRKLRPSRALRRRRSARCRIRYASAGCRRECCNHSPLRLHGKCIPMCGDIRFGCAPSKQLSIFSCVKSVKMARLLMARMENVNVQEDGKSILQHTFRDRFGHHTKDTDIAHAMLDAGVVPDDGEVSSLMYGDMEPSFFEKLLCYGGRRSRYSPMLYKSGFVEAMGMAANRDRGDGNAKYVSHFVFYGADHRTLDSASPRRGQRATTSSARR